MATLATLGAAAKAAPGFVLGRARIRRYARSLRPRLARFSRARASTASPSGPLLVCATRAEARAARHSGARVAVVGLGAHRDLPEGPLVSFGLAGSLHDGLAAGEVLDATRIVNAEGATLWAGGPLGVSGAKQGTILAADRVVDDPAERRWLHERTGADAVDMESGTLARSGRLAGCLRSVSDTPTATLGPLAHVLDDEGRIAWTGVARALARPRRTWRSLARVRLALRRLHEVAA